MRRYLLIAFLACQIGYPFWALFKPVEEGPAWFAWHMYSRPPVSHLIQEKLASGELRPSEAVSSIRPHFRGDVTITPALVRHACGKDPTVKALVVRNRSASPVEYACE